uniref:Solute carrier family 13 member 2-like n=1 Tax=Pelodiscus sinensis TaxID=13735 RepID=K7GGG5_PELSI
MPAVWRVILAHRNYLIAVLVPLLLLPLPLLVPTKEAQCGYVIILMALFWCMEVLPLAVTALFPVLLFPLMNIMDSTQVCMEYLKDTNMLFIGGLMVAIAVEHWNLHKRIALRVLLVIGVRPALLIMGFMVVTAFLSMWISNTATTAMMVPISQAVLEQLHKSEQEKNSTEHVAENINKAFELQEVPGSLINEATFTERYQILCPWESQNKVGCMSKTIHCYNHPAPQLQLIGLDNGYVLTVEEEEKLKTEKQLQEEKHLTFCKGMSLSVCYAASIGGIATLTGTTPNLVMKGQMDDLFPKNNNVVNFASWFVFAFPTMLLLLIVSWVWLQIMFLGFE